MFRRGARLNALVLWALVPLTVAGSLPRTGCICANGDYKLWFAAAPSRCCLEADPPAKAAGQCASCHRADRTERAPKSSDGHDGGSCCHTTGSPASCPTVIASRCCTPVVGVPVLPPAKDEVAVPHDDSSPALLVVPMAQVSVAASAAVAEVRNTDLPAPDLLIVHQVFLI